MKQENPLQNELRAVRLRLGLSQQELAQAAGVTRQTIGGIEGGLYSPSATVALRLARALGCRVEDLFWLDEEFPTLTAVATRPLPPDREVRVALAQVGGKWVAQLLVGEAALRTEMIPCDGVGRAAPDGTARVRLLDDLEALSRTVVLAGCTPVLSLWARAAERWHPGLRVRWSFANSMEALRSLARGEVHAAGVHLHNPETGEFNAPFAREVLGNRAFALIHLGVWEEGLLVAPGNPLHVRGAADMARPGLRLVNREEGAGSRLHLDQLLAAERIAPDAVQGYRCVVPGHWEVAHAIACGAADVGVSTATVATAYGLNFVPLREVRYDLALLREYLDLEPVRQLLSTLDHRWVRSQFSVLGGYRTENTGELVA